MSLFRDLKPSERIAIYSDEDGDFTYQEFLQFAYDSAGTLRPPDLLAIEFSNSVASIAAYVGALRRQIPVLLSNPNLAPQNKAKLYSDYRVSVVHSATEGSVRLSERGPECHPELQLLLSTSGSTGTNKFVRLSQKNLLSNTLQIEKALEIPPSSTTISTLPLHYAFGLSVLNTHLHLGAAIAITARSMMEKPFWDLFHRSQVNSLYGVPTTFEQLLRLRLSKEKVPSLLTLAQAGGKLGTQTAKSLSELCDANDWDMHFMYGQTEATARMAVSPPSKALAKSGSIGKPVVGGSFQIVDEQGTAIEKSLVPGRLIYSGPNVMLGYAHRYEDLSKGDEQGGVLDTRDIAQVDSEGDYYIVGRQSRFVKIHGARICLDTLESVITSPESPVRIVGDDSQIVLVAADEQKLQQLKQKLVSQFKIAASSIKTLHVDSLPTLDSGKADYAGLWRIYVDRKSS